MIMMMGMVVACMIEMKRVWFGVCMGVFFFLLLLLLLAACCLRDIGMEGAGFMLAWRTWRLFDDEGSSKD